jgi:hypothetical protein
VTGDSFTSGQRAVVARRAIGTYTLARHQPALVIVRDTARRGRDSQQERLSRLLCGLRHHADHVRTLSFQDVLATARQEANHKGARRAPLGVIQTAAVAQAISTYEASNADPGQYHATAWPSDAVANLRAYASRRGISFEAAVADLTSALVLDLRRYADGHGLGFETALTASTREYTGQRLREEGPFETGQDAHSRCGTLLVPVPGTASFGPVATHQGIVTSFEDAEWHLVRTAARIRDRERRGIRRPYLPDRDDRRALADAVGEACGLPSSEILGTLAARIEARARDIEHGVITAAELGRLHGRAGTEPYCSLDMDGDDSPLMRALGETECPTDANHWHRLALIDAYTEAYQAASRCSLAPAISPVRLAARDFPLRQGKLALPGSPATALAPGSSTPRTIRSTRHRPRRHAP